MASKKSRIKKPVDETLTKAGELVAGLSGHKPFHAAMGSEKEPNEIHMDWYRQWTRMGRSTYRIAMLAGVHQSTVHEAVNKVRKWIFRDGYVDAKAYQHKLTELCEFIIEECGEAWEKSKTKAVTVTTESGTSAGEHGGPWTKESVREEEQYGDVAVLGQMRGAMADIRAMWGIDEPHKVDIKDERSEVGGLERVAGKQRAQAIIDQSKALAQLADTLLGAANVSGNGSQSS